MSDAPALLPNNATPGERAIEQATARIAAVPVPIRDVWNPDTCPARLLPWLAWALSLDSWQPYWPESVKRARIRAAIEIQRRKGTVKSVRDTVASFGTGLALREWWQQDPLGEPHTFQIVLTPGAGVPNDAAYQADVIAEVERTKPVRSHFTFIAGLSATGEFGLLGAGRLYTYRRISGIEAQA